MTVTLVGTGVLEAIGAETPRGEGSSRPRSAADDQRLRRMLDDHHAFIWRQLRRFGVPEGRVDDAAQEVFLVAAAKLDAIREGSERSYLFGTALRVASQVRRSAQVRREVSVSTPPEVSALQASPEDLLDRGRARAILDAILDAMDDELRTVFVLYELEGMTTPAIATMLEIPGGTAASRLRRAREVFEGKVSRLFPKGGPR